ncbi:MAG: class I SAM-dependent RNA methyltransferase [Paracoccaceae bacterium]
MRVTIDRLGHLGDGIAPGPVYAFGALPGETVEGALEGDRLQNPKIVTPSPDRVRAPCRHAGRCGGCALQHASDAFVAGWKTDVVRQALDAQGLDVPVRPIVTSPAGSRRRAVLSGRRTKAGAMIGFHERASDQLVEIPDCRLLHPDILAAIPGLSALVVAGGSRKGELTLTVTRATGGPDVSVTCGKVADGPLAAELAGLAGAHGLARLSWNGEVVAQSVHPEQIFGSARVVPPPGAFLQATAEGEATLVAGVVEALGDARSVADLFSGCGTFALPLARNASVHAVEGDAAMLAALDAGWRRSTGLKAVTTETRDLFRRPLLADELARFDAVVIDPPRAGCEAQAQALAGSTVPVIAAVSCNPVSFARDARLLVAGGYRLKWVMPVDQFRWSTHVELVARFSRQ